MIVGIADTHTVFWYLADEPQLSDTARAFIKNAAGVGDAATAIYFKVPIISKDSKIQLSDLKTIW